MVDEKNYDSGVLAMLEKYNKLPDVYKDLTEDKDLLGSYNRNVLALPDVYKDLTGDKKAVPIDVDIITKSMLEKALSEWGLLKN